jgi:hypothetical protein
LRSCVRSCAVMCVCAWRSTNHQRRQRRSGPRAIPASSPSAAPPPADPRPARPAVGASNREKWAPPPTEASHGTLCAQKGWSPKKGNMTVGMPARRLAAVVPAPPWWIAFITTTHESGLVMCVVCVVLCCVVLCVCRVCAVCDWRRCAYDGAAREEQFVGHVFDKEHVGVALRGLVEALLGPPAA